jgi:2',3'-cyclic-nucleotide 2'-phosphodiesterase (5'-nucleotidase family)
LTDFGLETLGDLVEKTTFPWLMSNVIDNETGRPLADGKVTQTLDNSFSLNKQKVLKNIMLVLKTVSFIRS